MATNLREQREPTVEVRLRELEQQTDVEERLVALEALNRNVMDEVDQLIAQNRILVTQEQQRQQRELAQQASAQYAANLSVIVGSRAAQAEAANRALQEILGLMSTIPGGPNLQILNQHLSSVVRSANALNHTIANMALDIPQVPVGPVAPQAAAGGNGGNGRQFTAQAGHRPATSMTMGVVPVTRRNGNNAIHSTPVGIRAKDRAANAASPDLITFDTPRAIEPEGKSTPAFAINDPATRAHYVHRFSTEDSSSSNKAQDPKIKHEKKV